MAALQRRCCVLICSGDESPRMRWSGLWDVSLSSLTALNLCFLIFRIFFFFCLLLTPQNVRNLPSICSPPSLSLPGWLPPPSFCVRRENPADVKAPHTSQITGLQSFQRCRTSDKKEEDSMKCFFFFSKTEAPAVKMFFLPLHILSFNCVISLPFSILSPSHEGQVLHRTLGPPPPSSMFPSHPTPHLSVSFDDLLFLQNPNGRF